MFQSAKVHTASLTAAYLLSLSQPVLSQLSDNIQSTETLPKLPKVEMLVSESKEYQQKRTAFELAKTLASIQETGRNIEQYKELTGENSIPCEKIYDQINLDFQDAVKFFESGSLSEASEKALEVLFKQEDLNSKVVRLNSEYILVQDLSSKTAQAIKEYGVPRSYRGEETLDRLFDQQRSYSKSYFRMDSDSCFDLNSFKDITAKLLESQETSENLGGFLKFLGAAVGAVITGVLVFSNAANFTSWLKDTRGKIENKFKDYSIKSKQEHNQSIECDTKLSEALELLERYSQRKKSLWSKESFPALILDERSKLSYQELTENLDNLHNYLAKTINQIRQVPQKEKITEFDKARIIPHLGLSEPEKANIQELLVFYKQQLDKIEEVLSKQART